MKLIGHQWALDYLKKQLDSGSLRSSYLFLGPRQVGKATLALTLGMLLNCEATEGARPCGQCRSCSRIARGTHQDVVLVAPAATNFVIDQVRELGEELSLSPRESCFKVRILSEFDSATREAQNALLKTLEEPPAHAILILTASDRQALAPTIVSRCQVLNLKLVPPAEIRDGLVERGMPPGEAASLAVQAGGRPGWALRALEDAELQSRRSQDLADTALLVTQGRAQRLRYSEDLGKRDRAEVLDTLRLWKAWWHDQLLASAGAEAGYLLPPEERAVSLPLPSTEKTAAFMRSLNEIEDLIERNVNVRLALNVLMLRMPHLSNQPRR